MDIGELYSCSFCGGTRFDWLMGTDDFICDSCMSVIRIGNGIELENENLFYLVSHPGESLRCSFCYRDQQEVGDLVGTLVSPACICLDCANISLEEIDNEEYIPAMGECLGRSWIPDEN